MADNSRHVDLLDRAAGTGGRFYAVNSPRSLEACLRTGYDPAELLPRHPSTYATPDMSRSMVHAMGKHFETRRREKVAAVSAERQNIIGYLDGMKDPEEAATGSMLPAVTGAGKTGGSQTGRSMNASLGAPVVVAETIEDRVAKMQSQMMANEMDRLQAAQKRQEKELKRMVEGEQKLADLQVHILANEGKEHQRKLEHDRMVAKARVAAVAKKREMEEARQQEVRDEERERRRQAEADVAVVKKLAAVEANADRARALEARRKEEERRAKMEARIAKTTAALQEQQDLAARKLKDMEVREIRLNEQMVTKKAIKAQQVQEERDAASARIQKALERNQKIQVDKKVKFDNKVSKAQVLAEEKRVENVEVYKKMAKERKQVLAVRAGRLADAAQVRTDARQRTIDKREHREKYYGEVMAVEHEKHMVRKLESVLKKEDKLSNVARIKRVNEFNRLQTKQKIELDDQRSMNIRREREMLIASRKATAHTAFLRKEFVRNQMEKMRISNKFSDLTQLLDGGDDGHATQDLAQTM